MKKKICLLPILLILSIIDMVPVFASDDIRYKTIVEAKYDDAQLFSEGYAAVCQNGKWGYINEKGEWLVEPMYDYAAYFSEEKAVVGNIKEEVQQAGTEWEYTEKYCELGFIDNQGKFTPLLAESRLWQPTVFKLVDGTTVKTINTDTTPIKPKFQIENCLFEYDGEKTTELIPVYFLNGYLLVELKWEGDGNDAWIFDSNGKMINPYVNYNLNYNTENGETLYTDKLWGIYTDGMISGEQCTRGIPEKIIYYDINKNEQFSIYCYLPAFSDLKEDEVENAKRQIESMNIEYCCDYYISPFNDGYAWTFIYENEGIETEEHNYTFGTVKVHSYTVYCKKSENPKFALIDKKGNIVFSGNYEGVNSVGFEKKILNNGRIVLKDNAGKFGAVDKNGNVKIPFEYEQIFAFSDTVTSAKKDGVWYQIDTDGKEIYKTDYDFVSLQNSESKTSLAKRNGEFFVITNNNKISDSEKIASEKYYIDDLNAIAPTDIIIIKENGKYGYAKLQNADTENLIKEIVWSESEKITVTANKDATLYIASYNCDTFVSATPYKITANTPQTFDFNENQKAFLWDENMRPLCNKFELNNLTD